MQILLANKRNKVNNFWRISDLLSNCTAFISDSIHYKFYFQSINMKLEIKHNLQSEKNEYLHPSPVNLIFKIFYLAFFCSYFFLLK